MKRHAFPPSGVMPVAALPAINKSAAFTPVTASLKSTSICASVRTVEPCAGVVDKITGGVGPETMGVSRSVTISAAESARL